MSDLDFWHGVIVGLFLPVAGLAAMIGGGTIWLGFRRARDWFDRRRIARELARESQRMPVSA